MSTETNLEDLRVMLARANGASAGDRAKLARRLRAAASLLDGFDSCTAAPCLPVGLTRAVREITEGLAGLSDHAELLVELIAERGLMPAPAVVRAS